MVLPLLAPSVAATMLGINGFGQSRLRYVAGLCAALMAGWTVLLVWADRDPIARRGVLLLTVCPVVLGLAAAAATRCTAAWCARYTWHRPWLFSSALPCCSWPRIGAQTRWPVAPVNRADLMVLVNFP